MARIARIGTGLGMVVLGLFLLVLPGPGILTIAAGLAVLAPEFGWARRLLDWMKHHLKRYLVRPDAKAAEDDTSPNARPRSLGEEAAGRD